MSQQSIETHDEVVESFVQTCRHCKKTVDEHARGHCLFASTFWYPMSRSEWAAWRKSVWADLGGIIEAMTRGIREDDP